MKTLPLILLCTLSAVSAATAREWTNSAGKKLEAEFVEKKGAEGSETVVVKTPAGKTHEIPLSSLSTEDQEFVKAQPAAAEKKEDTAKKGAGDAKAGAPSIFQKMLDGKLVALDGKRVAKYEMKEEPKFYAFYFSAHWCPPCREFTPKLVEFYNQQEGKKKDFEIIFVSSDRGEDQMEEYIKGDKMPWPAIGFRNVQRMKEIKKYCGNGIPCLVLVDREGKVISDSYDGENYLGPNKVMNEIPEKTKPAEAKTAETATN